MDNWFLYYECLKDYKDTYGNSDVPISYWTTKDGVKYNLGQWVNSQRGKYQKGSNKNPITGTGGKTKKPNESRDTEAEEENL